MVVVLSIQQDTATPSLTLSTFRAHRARFTGVASMYQKKIRHPLRLASALPEVAMPVLRHTKRPDNPFPCLGLTLGSGGRPSSRKTRCPRRRCPGPRCRGASSSPREPQGCPARRRTCAPRRIWRPSTLGPIEHTRVVLNTPGEGGGGNKKIGTHGNIITVHTKITAAQQYYCCCSNTNVMLYDMYALRRRRVPDASPPLADFPPPGEKDGVLLDCCT